MNRSLHAVGGALIAAAALVVPAWVPVASATAKIANVRLASLDDGAESGAVGTDARGVIVLFDYTGASKTKMRVIAYNNGGDALVTTDAKAYSGDGTARVEIAATMLVHGAAEQIELLADNLLSLAELGGDNNKVDGQIIDARLSLERDLISLSRVLVPMDRAGLTGDALAALQTFDRLLPQVEAAVTELKAIPLTDVAAIRARLVQLEPVATELAAAGGDLNDLVAGLDNFTMAALYADNAPYTFAVKVDEVGSVETTGGSVDLVVVSGKGAAAADAASTPVATMTPRIAASFGQNNAGAATRAPAAQGAATTAPDRSAAGATAAVAADPTALRQAKLANATAQVALASQPAADAAGGVPAGEAAVDGLPVPAGDAAAAATAPVGAASVPLGAGAAPLPTFTVPAGGVAAGGAGSAPAGGRGPNLLVLGGGVVALIGLALWFRRRA